MPKTTYANEITFPEVLPITAHLSEIEAALEKHQVVVVAGETGSGKTTQLPKLLLKMGRGAKGLIGHTQPRRIAARSVAMRLAEELKTSLGETVGFQVRFSQHLGERTYIKLMTDGILLAELTQDRLLKRYDAIIIDEAHERSLNIDFILGYLKWLLPKRPDLKIIITSATLDHQRFSQHFNNCPVIEVSGRSYPVEIRYQSLSEKGSQEIAQMQGILDAVKTCKNDGDILVFLSGEREIRQTSEFLKKSGLRHTEILPLFSKLSTQEQQKVFHPGALRRIILSTNVAETSLTLPNIYYVIDTGLARIKRYHYRSKIQRLQVEPISKASAQQRAGRSGRVAPGVCIRLYEASDFELREAYTQPEILRSNLANVILQMMLLRLGDPEQFPWLDAPESQYWKDAYQCLEELHAIERKEEDWVLTSVGRNLAKLPIDPRLGRMLLTAEQKSCLAEVLVMVSALSVGDVFQHPMKRTQQNPLSPRGRGVQAADAAQRGEGFSEKNSDFLTYLNLWRILNQYQEQHSKNKLRQFCDENFLNYLRFREWQDMLRELSGYFDASEPLKVDIPEKFSEAERAAIHQSVLSGLLSHVAMREEAQEYLATRQRYLKIFPGSVCAKKPPPWIMAMEIVETKQVYARTVAAIESAWIEPLAPHLIKKIYGDPHFDVRRGEVTANEKVLFFGLPIIQKRRIQYGRIDPALSHEIFVREALAQRQLKSAAAFWVHNEKFLNHLEELEESMRARHFVPDEEWLFAFYQEKIPLEIHNQVDLEKWVKTLEKDFAKSLFLHEGLLSKPKQDHEKDYPRHFDFEGNALKLSYQFSPGSPEDGVSVEVPLALLPRLRPELFEALVPGFLPEKIGALFKALPKALRLQLQGERRTMTDRVLDCLALLSTENFWEGVAHFLQEEAELDILPQDLSALPLPDFLKFNFKIMNQGQLLGMGRDLLQLKAEYVPKLSPKLKASSAEIFHACPDTPTPEMCLEKENGLAIKKYFAWFAVEEGVRVTPCDHLLIAKQIHAFGVIKLLRMACQQELKYLQKNFFKMFKALMPAIECALVRMTFDEDFWHIREAKSFEACLTKHRADLMANAQSLLPVVKALAHEEAASAWLSQIPWEWLLRYPAYLQAIRESGANEASVNDRVAPLEAMYESKKTDYFEAEGLVFAQLENLEVSEDPPLLFYPEASLPEVLTRAYYLLEELRAHLLWPRFKPIESISEPRWLNNFLSSRGMRSTTK